MEPLWIEVSHHVISGPIKSPLKLAHLADLHIGEPGIREKRLLKLLKREKVDAILISGDSISNTGNYSGAASFLKELSAPLGVWRVRGNWEHWKPDDDEIRIYSEAGVRFLNNANHQLIEGVWIIGLDDNLAGRPSLKTALPGVPQEAFKIGLFHSPDYFESNFTHFDLALAGHTHGGQIRMPLKGPLWLPPGSGPYISGWYTNQNSKMHVSRGIGNSIFELRFLCRPELPIITIVPN